MSYDIGDGYFVDDDGNIQQYASERTKDSDTVTYQTDGYTDADTSDTSSGFNLKDIGKLLSGTSSFGMAGQLAGLGGIGSLLNKMLGSGGSGGYAGYQGGIPKYTAQRTQYALPIVPLPEAQQAKVTDESLKNFVSQQGLGDDRIARAMYKYGITPERMAGITSLPVADVTARYNQALGPNQSLANPVYGTPGRRPGSGGVTYFSPMQYNPVPTVAPTTVPTTVVAEPTTQPTVQAAGGGMMRGGITNLGGYSDGGQLLRGPGDGVSDDIPATIGDRQPARLADGEFVVPARIVSELGNGSTDAGARKLYAMMDRIKKTRSKAKNIAANTKAYKHLPA
jgi:hypothetical protein